jgi:hypothetical protein
MAAAEATASIPVSAMKVTKTLSFQSSWTRGAAALRACSMSTTAVSSSNSSWTEAAMSSASARERPTHAATISPTKRTLPAARIGSRECLKPLMDVAALIGLTLARSSAVTTLPLCFSGMTMDRRYACATELRTNATSPAPGIRKSPTY